MKSVLLIGDSIRMGYEQIVRDAISDVAAVWGPEENGGDSANVLAHLDEWVISKKPDVVHLNCGLHDLRRWRDREGHQVSLDDYRRNVAAIIEGVRSGTEAKLIWATITPLNEAGQRKGGEFYRTAEDYKAYNAASLEVVNEKAVPVDDLCSVVEAAGAEGLLTPDGVHYVPEGYALLGKTVAECVRSHMS